MRIMLLVVLALCVVVVCLTARPTDAVQEMALPVPQVAVPEQIHAMPIDTPGADYTGTRWMEDSGTGTCVPESPRK